MALLKLKKSSVAGKVPLTTDLAYGELALNYADGKLFFKSSTDTIQSFNTAAATAPVVPISLTAPTTPESGNLWWDSQAGKLKIYYNDTTSSQWVDAFSGSGGGTTGGATLSYQISAETDASGAILRLTDSENATQDINFTAGNNVTITATSSSAITISAAGNMLKATYDSDNDGKVDSAESADVALSVAWANITSKPTTFTPSTHTHVSADITDLGTTIGGYITTHEAASDPHSQYTTLVDVADATGDVHGVIDRAASQISFVDATRTFTIAPTGSSWTFYYHGILYTVTGPRSIVIANTSGARFIRVDPATLTLVEGGAVPDFATDLIVAYIYYNATTGEGIIIGDERHGYKRDTTWHSNQHLNVGTIWRSGGALTYTTDNAASVQIGISTPLLIADEDLLHTITHSATPSADYQQILNTAASLEVLYLSGTVYTSTAASTTPWIAGTSLARYNLVTGGSGSLVDATEGSYITYWLLATNDIRSPVKLVLGRAAHTTLDAAYAETFEEYGLSFAEQVFMQQIVVRTSSAYTANTAKIVIAAIRKVLSKVATSASTVSASVHNSLTGRDVADTHPIDSITGLTTALSGKQATLVSATNIKTVNGTTLLGSGDLTTPNTTYSIAAATTTGGANLTLSGSDASADTVKFAQSKFATVTQTDASTITIGTTYNITVGTTAPVGPSVGDLWIDTN